MPDADVCCSLTNVALRCSPADVALIGVRVAPTFEEQEAVDSLGCSAHDGLGVEGAAATGAVMQEAAAVGDAAGSAPLAAASGSAAGSLVGAGGVGTAW